MSHPPAIVWFRQDLRLADNPALHAAMEHGRAVIPLYIWAPEEEGDWPPGAASRVWLHDSLKQLETELLTRNARLIVRRGPTWEVLKDIIAFTGTDAVLWNRRYEPAAIARDNTLSSALSAAGCKTASFNGSLLFEPWEVQTQQGNPYQVFTPFWKACQKRSAQAEPLESPDVLIAPNTWPDSLSIDELELEPAIDWTQGIRSAWKPGEAGAHEQLHRFLADGLAEYPHGRDLPAESLTSRLSPYLHFGEISPRQVWHAVHRHAAGMDSAHAGSAVEKFLSEVGWREFAYHLLYHFPTLPNAPLRENFTHFPWHSNADALKAWQRGRTGYPLVDAGIRQLWNTGWMHNRVRMVVASFLTKHLLIDWREGARWFWDTLVDADLANNTQGWQWTAGCGADAAPYFRIFNPVSQGEKFDPNGLYVRQWVPELAKLPDKWIHKPWDAPASILHEAGIQLGKSYPQPIVDHKEARQRALAAYESIK